MDGLELKEKNNPEIVDTETPLDKNVNHNNTYNNTSNNRINKKKESYDSILSKITDAGS